MSHEPEMPDTRLAVSEDAAHRLLARAVELDARRPLQVQLEQLRRVAMEAGISAQAFESAIAELKGDHLSSDSLVEESLARRLWRRLRSDTGCAESRERVGVWEAAATNALAFVAFWVVMGLVSRIAGTLEVGWQVRHALMIGANLLGFGIALRLRGRITAVALAATAAMQAAQYPMHLFFGVESVQGGATKWALILAGLLGTALGVVLARRESPTPGTGPGHGGEQSRNTERRWMSAVRANVPFRMELP